MSCSSKQYPNSGIKYFANLQLFCSPLMQSPVKMRVEAFENAASAHSNLRPKRVKEVVSKDL